MGKYFKALVNVLSRKAAGFHQKTKSKSFWTEVLYKENFPLDGQNRLVNLPGAWPRPNSRYLLHYTFFFPQGNSRVNKNIRRRYEKGKTRSSDDWKCFSFELTSLVTINSGSDKNYHNGEIRFFFKKSMILMLYLSCAQVYIRKRIEEVAYKTLYLLFFPSLLSHWQPFWNSLLCRCTYVCKTAKTVDVVTTDTSVRFTSLLTNSEDNNK